MCCDTGLAILANTAMKDFSEEVKFRYQGRILVTILPRPDLILQGHSQELLSF